MKILLDMNLSPRWVSLLADQGVYGQLASRITGEQSRAALDHQGFQISHGH